MRLLTFIIILTAPLYVFAQGAQAPVGSLQAALAAHGGPAVNSILAIQLTGQSTGLSGTQPVTITAQMDGHVRFDYGQPVARSIVHTPDGEFVVQGTQVEHKQPFVEVFATLDSLSILGLKRLETGNPVWTDAGTSVDNGRTVLVQTVSTGQSQRFYGRLVNDQFQVAFDAQTGLVSSVTRQQYADKSMDLKFLVVYRFSDYRTVQNLVFPYRIEKSVFGRVTETIVLTSVQLNPAVSASTFER